MTIIEKIKSLWAVKSTSEEIYQEATKMDSASNKPGWKTTEFYLNVAAQLATLWGAVSGFIPPKIASIVSIAGVALYTVARTVSKAVTDIQAARAAGSTGSGDSATANVTVSAK
jgi:hypothetical protein